MVFTETTWKLINMCKHSTLPPPTLATFSSFIILCLFPQYFEFIHLLGRYLCSHYSVLFIHYSVFISSLLCSNFFNIQGIFPHYSVIILSFICVYPSFVCGYFLFLLGIFLKYFLDISSLFCVYFLIILCLFPHYSV